GPAWGPQPSSFVQESSRARLIRILTFCGRGPGSSSFAVTCRKAYNEGLVGGKTIPCGCMQTLTGERSADGKQAGAKHTGLFSEHRPQGENAGHDLSPERGQANGPHTVLRQVLGRPGNQ